VQLKVSDAERERLQRRIDSVVQVALGDHNQRMLEDAEDYRRFLAVVDPPRKGDEHKSNLKAPVIQARVLSKCGYNFAALFGDDAEIVATPTEESDVRATAKVAAFMNWRLFTSMHIQEDVQVSDFRRVLFGHTVIYRPWIKKGYWARYSADDAQMIEEARQAGKAVMDRPGGGADVEEVDYEGPGWIPCWPDDIMFPTEDVQNLQEYSWMVRKIRVTPDELLAGERAGRYEGIVEDWEEIVTRARSGRERGDTQLSGRNLVKLEGDAFEGVTYEAASRDGREVLELWEWYGKHRLPVGQDCEEWDLPNREMVESEIVVHYLPQMQKIVGIQDLRDLYPTMRNRRPFGEMRLIRTGRHRGIGIGRIMRALEDEETALYNLFRDCSEWGANPPILARPTAGVTEQNAKILPGHINFVADPSGIVRLDLKGDLGQILVGVNMVQSMQEKVDGQTDMTMGRTPDRPNAPRTASGQAMLLEQGNMRLNFDMKLLQLDIQQILADFWDMESSPLAPAEVFVRVTGEQYQGLIDQRGGGFIMTPPERGGKYDFKIQFATSAFSREADKVQFQALYGALMTNPVVMMRPDVMGYLAKQLAKKMGFADVASMIPAPMADDIPLRPEEEANKARQGERITVHPADHDDLHLLQHYGQIDHEKKVPEERQDRDYVARLAMHIVEHQQAKKQKMLMQAMIQGLQSSMGPAAEAGALPGVPSPAADSMPQ